MCATFDIIDAVILPCPMFFTNIGCEKHILTLCENLDRSRVEPSVVLFQSGGPLWKSIASAGGGTNVTLVPARVQNMHGSWVWDEAQMQVLVSLLQVI